MTYPRIASLKSAAALKTHAESLGLELPIAETLAVGSDAPLARSAKVAGRRIGNRFCILPMEGWDGELDGRPSELTTRRWRNFGLSGAKLIWGGEAVAVRQDGRANPNQLVIKKETLIDLARLREVLVDAHRDAHGDADDLLVGLQLTHSGRFCRPDDKKRLRPLIAYRHPLLDRKFRIDDDSCVLTDGDVRRLIEDFVRAAALAQKAGFSFVDVKHCHGYLGHEFLSAFDRPGPYGGPLENRTRFLREIIDGVRAEAPGLEVAVRLSAADWQPFEKGPDGVGIPMQQIGAAYRYAFGGDGTGVGFDFTEPFELLDRLADWGVELLCVTIGSPYYNPHIQRPAAFPPSDGYLPPEDPLVGVVRHLDVTAAMKRRRPSMLVVGSGYSYLQDWLPNVGQAVVAGGLADFVGLGRMVLSYPELPTDVLAGRTLQRKRICRTFSDCTTAPRNGLVSGCYPLDPLYKSLPEATELARLKKSSSE